MSISFKVQKYNSKNATIDATILPINLSSSPYEAKLEIEGYSYHLIFGRQINGWFICIPNWSIGAELAHPFDVYWNRTSLNSAGASKRDAYYIAEALSEINDYL